MTRKLYFQDPYIAFFDAEITNSIFNGDFYEIDLDATCFYPTSGGQLHDKGFINGIEVFDVLLKDNNIIHCLNANPDFKNVKCEIDFSRRYDFMQQHTGQHLLTSVFESEYNYKTLSSQLGEEYSTIELDTSIISENEIFHVEIETLKFIRQAIPVKAYFVNKDELKNIPIRKIVDIDEEEIRIVEIENVDHCLCGGTHLRNTSEINLIKVIGSEKIRGNIRLYFLCGNRAFTDYREKVEKFYSIRKDLGINDSELIPKIESLISENKNLKKDISNLNEQLFDYELSGLESERESDYLFKVKIFENIDRQAAGLYAKKLMDLNKSIGLIAINDRDMTHLFFVRSDNVNLNMAQILKDFLNEYGGKGGGKENFAQGGAKQINNIKQILLELSETLKEELKNER